MKVYLGFMLCVMAALGVHFYAVCHSQDFSPVSVQHSYGFAIPRSSRCGFKVGQTEKLKYIDGCTKHTVICSKPTSSGRMHLAKKAFRPPTHPPPMGFKGTCLEQDGLCGGRSNTEAYGNNDSVFVGTCCRADRYLLTSRVVGELKTSSG